jgi:hypothetical protein
VYPSTVSHASVSPRMPAVGITIHSLSSLI